MSDRKEFQANRDAGLAIRQQRRIETREELRRRTRLEVAEEIAAAIEAMLKRRETLADAMRRSPADYLRSAAELARDIGSKEAL